VVASFFGGEGGLWSKKGVPLRGGATDFREERNPPQADSIVSNNRESKLCTIQYYNITILPYYNIAILNHIKRTVLRNTHYGNTQNLTKSL
jgi:hypothetical protein